MASATVDRVRDGYEAFNRGDFEAVLSLMHPDIEWHRAAIAPDLETLRGVDAVKSLLVPDAFDEQRVELEEIVENGERVFVAARFRMRGRGSGIEFTERAFHVWTIREEKAVRVELFSVRAEAIEAAGLAA